MVLLQAFKIKVENETFESSQSTPKLITTQAFFRGATEKKAFAAEERTTDN
jgi:hypothetical protein